MKIKHIAKVMMVVLIIGLGISTVIAYAGIEPFASTKDRIIEHLPVSTTKTIWVRDITISPPVSLFNLRVVTVNLGISPSAFKESSRLGCKIALYSGDYYYGYYRIVVKQEDIDHLEKFGVDLEFPIPASEPVFQTGSEFNVVISSNPKWADLTARGLYDNPYSELLKRL
jgi:hypothetical protein